MFNAGATARTVVAVAAAAVAAAVALDRSCGLRAYRVRIIARIQRNAGAMPHTAIMTAAATQTRQSSASPHALAQSVDGVMSLTARMTARLVAASRCTHACAAALALLRRMRMRKEAVSVCCSPHRSWPSLQCPWKLQMPGM